LEFKKEMIEVTNILEGKSAPEVAEILRAKSAALKAEFDANTVEKDGKRVFNMSIAQLEAVRLANEELDAIGSHYAKLNEAEKASKQAEGYLAQLNAAHIPVPFANGPSNETVTKSVAESFTSSPEYRKRKSGEALWFGNGGFSVEIPGVTMKTVMSTAAGFAHPNNRSDLVVPFAAAPALIQSIIPGVTADVDSYKYMEGSTFTNNVDAAAEGGTLGEVAIAYTERSQPLEVIAGFIPVTEQQLEVEAFAQNLIESDLSRMHAIRLQAQILAGTGGTPNFDGFLSKSGTQTQALGADPGPDAAYKLMTKLRGGGGSGFVEPDAWVFHPNDWQGNFKLLRTGSGDYLWGNPAVAGPESLWGKPVLQTTACTENTGLCGDFGGFSLLVTRRGVRVDVGLNGDDFKKLQQSIRISSRSCLVIKRAAAFGKLTGI